MRLTDLRIILRKGQGAELLMGTSEVLARERVQATTIKTNCRSSWSNRQEVHMLSVIFMRI